MNAKLITDENLNEVLKLLEDNKLPYKDIQLKGNLFVSYNDPNGKLLGAGGLELYGTHSLLRSVVVRSDYRGKKLGMEIVEDLLSRAKKQSVTKIYLLTETAQDFFHKLGFIVVSRNSVASEVKASSEFTTVCPVSAVCMELPLRRSPILPKESP